MYVFDSFECTHCGASRQLRKYKSGRQSSTIRADVEMPASGIDDFLGVLDRLRLAQWRQHDAINRSVPIDENVRGEVGERVGLPGQRFNGIGKNWKGRVVQGGEILCIRCRLTPADGQ